MFFEESVFVGFEGVGDFYVGFVDGGVVFAVAVGDGGEVVFECGDEAVDVFGFLVQDVKCDALGAFWPDAGQSGEFVDEILQWSFKHECLVYPLRRITRENPASGLIL